MSINIAPFICKISPLVKLLDSPYPSFTINAMPFPVDRVCMNMISNYTKVNDGRSLTGIDGSKFIETWVVEKEFADGGRVCHMRKGIFIYEALCPSRDLSCVIDHLTF